MKRPLIILALLFQISALAWMAFDREWIVQTGKRFYLRTAPIDPRDIFRGDFVRLNYDFSIFAEPQIKDGLREGGVNKGQEVYVPLTINSRGVAKADYVTDLKPREGPFLRGRIIQSPGAIPFEPIKPGTTLWVKYGIEQYFTEQGKGKQIEKRLGQRTGLQIPMEVEVALSDSGTAVITGHRWSPVGIGLEVAQRVERNPEPDKRSAVITLTLKNTTDENLGLMMLPERCSFILTSVKTAAEDLTLSRPECDQYQPDRAHLMPMAPKQERSFTFDFNDSPWHVRHKEQNQSIGELPWGQRFRLVYHSDIPEEIEVPEGMVLWRESLPSRAFHGRGNID